MKLIIVECLFLVSQILYYIEILKLQSQQNLYLNDDLLRSNSVFIYALISFISYSKKGPTSYFFNSFG